MPVSVKPWDHPSRKIQDQYHVKDIESLAPMTEIYGASLGEYGDHETKTVEKPWVRSQSGLLDAITIAYSGHHHLVIRPEDVWFQILTQFSLFVNANAEELRSRFVAHEGKKKLRMEYEVGNTRWTFDYGRFARDISEAIHANVTDPALRDWIIPDFSTTTETDREVACVLMMATLQQYFSYECGIECGIPSVTLLGERADYERLLAKLDKLEEYGAQTARFAKLLRPIMRAFIRTFDEPTSDRTIKFWRTICDIRSGSGFTVYTGWITAFCHWDDKGRCNHRYTDADDIDLAPDGVDEKRSSPHSWTETLYIDGIKYGKIGELPMGISTVPVSIDDGIDPQPVKAQMTVGLVGIAHSSSGQQVENPYSRDRRDSADRLGPPELDTLQPVSGWWIAKKLEDSESDPEAE